MTENEGDIREEDIRIERRRGFQAMVIKLDYMQRDLDEINKKLDKYETIFITRQEFEQRVSRLEKMAWGVITFFAVGVGGAILALIIKKPL